MEKGEGRHLIWFQHFALEEPSAPYVNEMVSRKGGINGAGNEVYGFVHGPPVTRDRILPEHVPNGKGLCGNASYKDASRAAKVT